MTKIVTSGLPCGIFRHQVPPSLGIELVELPADACATCMHRSRREFCADRTGILRTTRIQFAFSGDVIGRTAILEFFSSGAVAELAKSLAQDLARRYPPAIANNPAQVVSPQRLSDILEQVFARATDIGPEAKLGWYKRVRLGKGFRRELSELGYDDKFIGLAAESLILCVCRNPSLET